MNQTGPNAKEVKLLGDGGKGAIMRPSQAPKRLISAGEKAKLKADEADAALRRLNKEMGPSKPESELLIKGHAF